MSTSPGVAPAVAVLAMGFPGGGLDARVDELRQAPGYDRVTLLPYEEDPQGLAEAVSVLPAGLGEG